ncbi:MAG TPA: hypothetical protein VG936_05375 [Lacunisphaera sp.]|nr:hypothetical protein [Lacunisphaera sp.]
MKRIATGLAGAALWLAAAPGAEPPADLPPGWAGPVLEQRRLPTYDETVALDIRRRAFRSERQETRIAVFPVRTGDTFDAACASEIARQLCQSGLAGAATVAGPLALPLAPEADEARAGWALARNFGHEIALRGDLDGANYALYADIALDADGPGQAFVHFVVCDAAGRWVIVDFRHPAESAPADRPPATIDDVPDYVIHRLADQLEVPVRRRADAPPILPGQSLSP